MKIAPVYLPKKLRKLNTTKIESVWKVCCRFSKNVWNLRQFQYIENWSFFYAANVTLSSTSEKMWSPEYLNFENYRSLKKLRDLQTCLITVKISPALIPWKFASLEHCPSLNAAETASVQLQSEKSKISAVSKLFKVYQPKQRWDRVALKMWNFSVKIIWGGHKNLIIFPFWILWDINWAVNAGLLESVS